MLRNIGIVKSCSCRRKLYGVDDVSFQRTIYKVVTTVDRLPLFFVKCYSKYVFSHYHMQVKNRVYIPYFSHFSINGPYIVLSVSWIQKIHRAFSLVWIISLKWIPRRRNDFYSSLAYWQIISRKCCTDSSAANNVFPRLDIDTVCFLPCGKKILRPYPQFKKTLIAN